MVNHIERELAFRERQLQIETYREYYTEQNRRTRDIAADYGRWIIASLLLVNGGAIIALLQSSHLQLIQIKLSGAAFAAGISFSIICGLATWANWLLLNQFYEKYSNPSVIFGTQPWPEDGNAPDWVNVTFRISIFLGFMSLISFIAGVGLIYFPYGATSHS